jgi:hypothetical protein
MTYIEVFLLMIGAHALCDYPLQGDFLARAKNPNIAVPGVPWWQAMLTHSIIHGLAVGLIVGYFFNPIFAIVLAIAEITTHFVTDQLKCDGLIDFSQDQFMHVVWKLAWCIILLLRS